MGLTYVSATVTAKDGKEPELNQALAAVVAEVRAEDGCIRYDLHKSDDGKTFLFYEIWESMDHLVAHGKTPHMDVMRAATEDLVTGPAEVNIWKSVDVAD